LRPVLLESLALIEEVRVHGGRLPASKGNSPLLPLLSKLMLPQPRGVAVTATPVTAVHHTPHRAARTQRDRSDADIVLSMENPTMVIKRIALLQPP